MSDEAASPSNRPPQFKAEPWLNHGVTNPIVRRMFMQFSDILATGFVQVSPQVENQVREMLLELMQDLLHIQDTRDALIEREEAAKARMSAPGGIRREGAMVVFTDNPNPDVRKLFDEAVMRAAIALRRFRRLAGVLMGEDFKKGNALYNYVLGRLADDDPRRTWIENDNNWQKTFMDLRGDVEHEDRKIIPFQSDLTPDGQPVFTNATLEVGGMELRAVLADVLQSVFGYCEATLAMLLDWKVRAPVYIAQLDEASSAERDGVRYVLDIDVPLPVPAQ